jgi:hypothetical protein
MLRSTSGRILKDVDVWDGVPGARSVGVVTRPIRCERFRGSRKVALPVSRQWEGGFSDRREAPGEFWHQVAIIIVILREFRCSLK